MEKSYKTNKCKISTPTWNEEFDLPDGSHSVSDIQDYFEYILKRHAEKMVISSREIYVNKIENKIPFKINTEQHLKLLPPETIKFLGRNKNKITKDKNSENVPGLEIAKVVLVYCNIVSNNYQQDSIIFYAFIPNKPFGQLLEISPGNIIFLKVFNSEFSYIEVWFTDQNS